MAFLRNILQVVRRARTPLVFKYMVRTGRAMRFTTRRTLVVAPHPDDETFGCGGVIALKRGASVPVHVVFVTDGGASHGAIDDVEAQKLRSDRKVEALAACAILGVTAAEVTFLDLPDGQLSELDGEARASAVTRLADCLRAIDAQEVFTPRHDDLHPDHTATWRMTLDAIKQSGLFPDLLGYTIWMIWRLPLGGAFRPRELAGGEWVHVERVQALKDQAIDVYRTQIPLFPRGFLGQFRRGIELFTRYRTDGEKL